MPSPHFAVCPTLWGLYTLIKPILPLNRYSLTHLLNSHPPEKAKCFRSFKCSRCFRCSKCPMLLRSSSSSAATTYFVGEVHESFLDLSLGLWIVVAPVYRSVQIGMSPSPPPHPACLFMLINPLGFLRSRRPSFLPSRSHESFRTTATSILPPTPKSAHVSYHLYYQ